MESNPALLALGPQAVLHAVLDEVVDAYTPVIAGLENDIDEIENQPFGGDRSVSRRIYELLSEVVDFQRATGRLRGMLKGLLPGSEKYHVDVALQSSFRDVMDHVLRVTEQAASFRALLGNALNVHATLVTQQQQNDEMRAPRRLA